MLRRRLLATLVVLGLTGLTGCFSSVRRVAKVQVQAPGSYRTADLGALEKELSEREAAVKTLHAAVLITASTGGSKTGQVKTYTSFRGWIYVQKPRSLRVLLQLPVIGTRALDMVSDGSTFTLLIPPKNRAITGTNEVTNPSKNGLENLRPAVFLDSLLVPGVSADELVTLTESTRVLQPARGRKEAIEEPDYDVAVLKIKSGNMLHLERIVHISRLDLLPFEQDVYDDQGRVMTQALYENYQPGEPEAFPRLITIRRPLDAYELKIEITKLTMNEAFESDQFELKVPPGIKVEQLH